MTNKEYESKLRTTDEFIEMYSKALREYLNTQYRKNEKAHIEDIAVGNAMFAEAFYITVGVL